MDHITVALRRKLHFKELGLEERILKARSQVEVVQRFLEFAGDLPLIAHNGTFDYEFIKKHIPYISNSLVDSLELVVLAWPTAPSHAIEALAERFGLIQTGNRWQEVLELDKALGISQQLGVQPGDLFHSTIFDCLILYILLQDAQEKLRSLPDQIRAQFWYLSPNLAELVASPPLPETTPQSLAEILSLKTWIPDAQEFAEPLPEIPFTCQEEPVMEVYQHLLKKFGWQTRVPQKEMIRRVSAHFASGTQGMIEAPTGTGKTLAYLLPALIQARSTGQQVVVSTSTKALQDQLVHDLNHLIKPYLPFEFHFTVLKGQENYLCLSRLWMTYQENFLGEEKKEVPFEEKLCLLYLLLFAQESKEGDLQNTSFWLQTRFPIMGYLISKVCSQKETCGEFCRYPDYCFSLRAKALANNADLLIINHALLILKPWRENQVINLVIDEAHNLEDVVTSCLTEEASLEKFEKLLWRLLEPGDKRGLLIQARKYKVDFHLLNQTMKNIRTLRKLLRMLGGYLSEYVEKRGKKVHPKYGACLRLRESPRHFSYFSWRHVEEPLKQLISELSHLQEMMGKILLFLEQEGERAQLLLQEMQAIYGYLFSENGETPGQKTLLEDILRVEFDPLIKVHWIELGIQGELKGEEIPPQQITWAFKRAPVRVADILEHLIYSRTRAMVLTSATLTLGEGGFDFFRDRLGLTGRIPDEHLVQLPKAFNFSENVLLGMPAYMKTSARYEDLPRFKEDMARELACLFRYTEGRGLVLYTARDRMEYAANFLEKNLETIPVYWQRKGISTRALKEDFVRYEESILLGLRSFWEGIDVPGTSLSYLVIEKLPFPIFDDPIVEARREQIHAAGGNEWSDYLIPLAALQFKQGFGRLMRKQDDCGVVIFMDKRLRNDATYRETILRTLPGYKRTDEHKLAEENRETFYRAIGEHMQKVFPDWDWDERLTLFPCIRQDIITDLERILGEYELPAQISSEEFPKHLETLQNAAKLLIEGFQSFRPEQLQALQAILSGKDTLVVLPTGSGKSLTFQLPALLRKGVTIVFSPLIALMRDQVEKLRNQGLNMVDYIISGQTAAHRSEVYRRLVKGELRLVYIAPERIRDVALREALSHANVIQVVVDEAHCVYIWGPSFRPDYLSIPQLFSKNRPPMAALTATATKETREAIIQALDIQQDHVLVTKSVDRSELKFIVYNEKSLVNPIRTKKDKLRVLVKILRAAQKNDEVAIVYTATVRQAELLSQMLNLYGFTVRHYHGRMDTRSREDVQEMFREGAVRIIVATKAFGMGIDKADVRYVIHYEVPGDLESYYQEAGRAGRDGKTAYCVLLYHKSDIKIQKYFIEQMFPDRDTLNALVSVLQSKVDKNGRILARPEDLADEAGIELERLDVALQLLTQMGMVQRSYNFTLRANLLLNYSPEWIARKIDEKQAKLFLHFIKQTGASEVRPVIIDLLEVSYALSFDPVDLDKLLTELSNKGFLIYRAWDRGYILEAGENLKNGAVVSIEKTNVETFTNQMLKKLRHMIQYAEELGSSDCRREYILRYFNDQIDNRSDCCCDLCQPNMDVPWRDIPREEIPNLPVAINPNYMILRAIQWNSSLTKDKFAKPYTEKTLAKILTGDSFGAAQFEQDPVRRRQRIRRLEMSPFFSVLQGFRGGEKRICSIVERLVEEGFAEWKTITFMDSDDEITYHAPVLTPKGLEQLKSGKYLYWQ